MVQLINSRQAINYVNVVAWTYALALAWVYAICSTYQNSWQNYSSLIAARCSKSPEINGFLPPIWVSSRTPSSSSPPPRSWIMWSFNALQIGNNVHSSNQTFKFHTWHFFSRSESRYVLVVTVLRKKGRARWGSEWGSLLSNWRHP